MELFIERDLANRGLEGGGEHGGHLPTAVMGRGEEGACWGCPRAGQATTQQGPRTPACHISDSPAVCTRGKPKSIKS